MTCDDVRECFIDRLDGTLAPEREALVTAHLEGCAACREELEALRETEAAVRGLPRVAAPEALLERLRAALDAEARAAVSAPPRESRPPVPAGAAPGGRIIRPARFLGWARALSAVAAGVIAVAGVGIYWRGLQDLEKAEPGPPATSVRRFAPPDALGRDETLDKTVGAGGGVFAPAPRGPAGRASDRFADQDGSAAADRAAAVTAAKPPDTRGLAIRLGETYEEARAAVEALLLARGLDYLAVADAGGGLLFVARTTPGEYGALLNRIEVLPDAELEETKYDAHDAARAATAARELSTRAEPVAPAERAGVVLALGAAEYERRLAEIEQGAELAADVAAALAMYQTQIEAARARGAPASEMLGRYRAERRRREAKDVDDLLVQAEQRGEGARATPAPAPAPATADEKGERLAGKLEEERKKLDDDARRRPEGELAAKEEAPEAHAEAPGATGSAGAPSPRVAAGERADEADARNEAEARALAEAALTTAWSAAHRAREAGRTAPSEADAEAALMFEAEAQAALAESKQALEAGDLAAARIAYARSRRAFDDAYGLADRLRRDEAGRRLAGGAEPPPPAGAEADRGRLAAGDEQTLDGPASAATPPAKPESSARPEPPTFAKGPRPAAAPGDSGARSGQTLAPAAPGAPGSAGASGSPEVAGASQARGAASDARRGAPSGGPRPADATPSATPPAGRPGPGAGSDLPVGADAREKRPAEGGAAEAAPGGSAPSGGWTPPAPPPPSTAAPAGSGGGGRRPEAGGRPEGGAPDVVEGGTGTDVVKTPTTPEPSAEPSAATAAPAPEPARPPAPPAPPADPDPSGYERPPQPVAPAPSTVPSTGEVAPEEPKASGKRATESHEGREHGKGRDDSGLKAGFAEPPARPDAPTFGRVPSPPAPALALPALDPDVARLLEDLRRDGRIHVVRVTPEPGSTPENGVLVLIRVAPAPRAAPEGNLPAAALRREAGGEAPAAPSRK